MTFVARMNTNPIDLYVLTLGFGSAFALENLLSSQFSSQSTNTSQVNLFKSNY